MEKLRMHMAEVLGRVRVMKNEHARWTAQKAQKATLEKEVGETCAELASALSKVADLLSGKAELEIQLAAANADVETKRKVRDDKAAAAAKAQNAAEKNVHKAEQVKKLATQIINTRENLRTWGGGGLTMVDVSVVHPAADPYRRAAARTTGSAACRDVAKRAKYASADPDGCSFKPLSVETSGRLWEPAMELLNDLETSAASSGTVQKDNYVVNVLQELRVALCLGNPPPSNPSQAHSRRRSAGSPHAVSSSRTCCVLTSSPLQSVNSTMRAARAPFEACVGSVGGAENQQATTSIRARAQRAP